MLNSKRTITDETCTFGWFSTIKTKKKQKTELDTKQTVNCSVQEVKEFLQLNGSKYTVYLLLPSYILLLQLSGWTVTLNLLHRPSLSVLQVNTDMEVVEMIYDTKLLMLRLLILHQSSAQTNKTFFFSIWLNFGEAALLHKSNMHFIGCDVSFTTLTLCAVCFVCCHSNRRHIALSFCGRRWFYLHLIEPTPELRQQKSHRSKGQQSVTVSINAFKGFLFSSWWEIFCFIKSGSHLDNNGTENALKDASCSKNKN